MGKYKKDRVIIIYAVYITLPFLILLIGLSLLLPLKVLAFLGGLGESIFGDGNGAILLVVLGFLFIGISVPFLNWLEKKENEKNKG